MKYELVYDITTQPAFDIEVAYLAGGLFLLGAVWALFRKLRRQVPTTGYVMMGFATLIALIGIGLMSWDHARLVAALERGDAKVVEGAIGSWSTERVRTARSDRREYNTYERFFIGQEIWFGYYWEVGQAGFHNAGEKRIELRDGMRARATYVAADGEGDPPRILRLEIVPLEIALPRAQGPAGGEELHARTPHKRE